MSVMIERLEGMVNRYHEITDLMMMPEVASDSRQLAKLGREQAELTQVVETYTEYRKTAEALEEAKTLLHEEDKEMREMARMEIEELEPKQEELLQKLELLLIPKDPNDSHNAFLEVRGAAGGDEGNIFRKKMDHAAKLMELSHLKIKDIAEAVGMKDQLYFNKVFRRFYQESPRTYRSKL